MNIPRYKILQKLPLITIPCPSKVNGGRAPHQITSPAHFLISKPMRIILLSDLVPLLSSIQTNYNQIESALPRRCYLGIKPIPVRTSHSFIHSRPLDKYPLERCWEKVIHRVLQICRIPISWVTLALITFWTEQERQLHNQGPFILHPDSATFPRTLSATVQHQHRLIGCSTRGTIHQNCKVRTTLTSEMDQQLILICLKFSFSGHIRTGPAKRTPGRLPRVPFTPEQLSTLEDSYKISTYLSSDDANKLADRLDLSNVRVKIWFQNRRARERRERRDQEAGRIEVGDCDTVDVETVDESDNTSNSSLWIKFCVNKIQQYYWATIC